MAEEGRWARAPPKPPDPRETAREQAKFSQFDRSGPFGNTRYIGTPGEEDYRQETTLPPLEQARIDFSRALAMPALFGVGNQMAQFQPAGGFGEFIRPQANPYAGMQQMLGGMMGQGGGGRMPGGGGMGPGGSPMFNPGGGFGGGKGGMLSRLLGGGGGMGRGGPGGQPMPGGMPRQQRRHRNGRMAWRPARRSPLADIERGGGIFGSGGLFGGDDGGMFGDGDGRGRKLRSRGRRPSWRGQPDRRPRQRCLAAL